MNIPQTSASERIETAREAYAEYDRDGGSQDTADLLAAAIRGLIEAPGVHESEHDMIQGVIQRAPAHVSGRGILFQYDDLIAMVADAIRVGIQAAHETWEPADVPSQEFMLRHLGLRYNEGVLDASVLHVDSQFIEKEVI